MKLSQFVTLMVSLLSSLAHAEAPVLAGTYALTRQIQVGGEGRWDYITLDPAAQRLYVPRSTYTLVIQLETGKVVGTIPDTSGVHGVALAVELNRGFTSNGKANTVTVFDLNTLAVLGTVPTGANPDAILYEASTKRVYTCNGRSGDVTVIDATAAKPGPDSVIATIAVGGKLETPASDGAGKIFVAIEDKDSIGVIDTKTLKLTTTWPLEGAKKPSGLSIDAVHHRIFVGCGGNNVMAVVDTATGKTLATPPIGAGVDACGFDPGTGEAFASCGDASLTVVKETRPGTFEVVQTAKTQPGARTMALDPGTHTIYLATSDMAPPAPGERRPTPVAGTFRILVVTRGS